MFQFTRMIRTLFLALAAVLLWSLVLSVAAQEPVSDDDVNAVAKELYCPICESTPLDVCATQACADWREVIRTKLGEGQTAQEIKDYFELQYGPQALAEPPRSGFSLAVWILPVIAVIVGAFFFFRYIQGLRAADAGAAAVAADGGAQMADPAAVEEPAVEEPAQDDYRARVESELREL